MPRGHPDHGQSQSQKIVSSVTDLGELAARLDSPNRFHRGGNAIFQTSFESGADNCGFSSGYGGADWYLVGDPTYQGGVSCMLKSMGIDILTRPIDLTKIGFEVSWQPISEVNMLELKIVYDDGSDAYAFEFFTWLTSDLIQLDDKNGVNQDIATYEFNSPYVNLWNISKGVIDLENLTYDKLYFNHKVYNVSDYEPEKQLSSGDERLTCTFFSYPTTGGVGQTVIDNLIITINEP